MPLRKFELLSLVGRKKQQEEALPPPSSSHSSSRPPYTSGFNRAPSTLPPPPPAPALPTRDGFYSSVQYERLTPSVNGRPPVLGPSSTMGSARSSSFHSVSHAPPLPSTSPAQVQYERIGPSASSSVRLPSPQYERITPGSASPSTLLNHRSPVPSYRQSSPLQYDSGPRNASFPSPSTHSLPSPPVALHSPVDVPPLRSDALRRDRRGGGPPLAPVAENGSPNVPMGDSTPSDKSTPFSMVMEEWMSQLRTPTPDVMLLPSPYDFNKDTPTPVERMEDIKHINEALLPTPPPASAASLGVQDQMTQGTKSSDFVLSSANPNNNNRRPLVEDIASLCRDLITQEVSEQLAKRLMKMGAFATAADASAAVRKATGSFSNGGAFGRQPSSRKNDDNDDDDDQFDDTSSIGGSVAGGGKGKRRKMCTSEGCQNLSRSRGLCKAHGGGRRCSVDGCTRASQSGSLCITHGGGKRCTVDGCDKAAQSRGMCKAHGGGVRCRVDGCTKSSQGDGYCRTHGGGRRCGHESGCQKWAQRNGMCMAHSEGRYGNSYRGRVARRADDPNTSIGDAAQALVKASMSS